MFTSLNRISNYSIRGLAISSEAKEEVRTKLGLYKNVHKSRVNTNAGSELLLRYQTQWQQMHELNEINAKKAEEIAKVITETDRMSKKLDTSMDELLTQLSSLPQFMESIDLIEKDLLESKKLFVQIEQILTNLEDIKEVEEFEKLKLDQNYKVMVYKDTKDSELEAIRVRLAVEHTNRVKEFEKQHQNILKERQEAFQMAFEEELNRYKTHGKIERQESNPMTTSIEEIVIEAEQSDEAALEEFLQS